MLKWPNRAASAVRKLFEPLQDIDVYVEDENDEAFYRSLLQTVAGEEIKIARVFSLGGRGPVVDAAMLHNHSLRRALFIIDGDLPWVKGHTTPTKGGLHMHNAYCVENLLICKRAITTILAQEKVLTEDDANDLLAFEKWRNYVEQPLTELFAAYATLNDFDPTVATVSIGINTMCSPSLKGVPQKLELGLVATARDRALLAAETCNSKEAVNLRYQNYCHRIQSLEIPLNAASGKDYVMPLLDFHLQSLGCRIKRKSLRLRLACIGDASRFDRLRHALRQAARGQFI